MLPSCSQTLMHLLSALLGWLCCGTLCCAGKRDWHQFQQQLSASAPSTADPLIFYCLTSPSYLSVCVQHLSWLVVKAREMGVRSSNPAVAAAATICKLTRRQAISKPPPILAQYVPLSTHQHMHTGGIPDGIHLLQAVISTHKASVH